MIEFIDKISFNTITVTINKIGIFNCDNNPFCIYFNTITVTINKVGIFN